MRLIAWRCFMNARGCRLSLYAYLAAVVIVAGAAVPAHAHAATAVALPSSAAALEPAPADLPEPAPRALSPQADAVRTGEASGEEPLPEHGALYLLELVVAGLLGAYRRATF